MFEKYHFSENAEIVTSKIPCPNFEELFIFI